MATSQTEIELFLLHETSDALLVAVDDDEATPEVWIPKYWKGDSLAWERKGANIILFAPEELLIEKGLV